jgi:hypothetical protein
MEEGRRKMEEKNDKSEKRTALTIWRKILSGPVFEEPSAFNKDDF